MTLLPKPEKRARKPRKRPRKQRKGTPAALAREADRLWSLIVRDRGFCEYEDGRPHGGPLQGGHCISRRYRNTRWLPINGVAICASHHLTTTYDPIRWDNFIRNLWGQQTYNELRLLALRTTPPDVAEALEKLRAEAKQRGIE